MTVIGINGSPRKKWNTGTLVASALEGAASAGAETELVHLYDLDYKGCTSCFACKLVDGPSSGRCAWQDDLTPVLRRIEERADTLILGSPIYFGAMTGEMRSFLERLLFAPLLYTRPPKSRTAFPRRINVGVIYTMNLTREGSLEHGYDKTFAATEASLENILGSTETFCCYDTCQFADYSKVIMEMMDPVEKERRHREVFPEECRRAYEFGRRLAVSGRTASP